MRIARKPFTLVGVSFVSTIVEIHPPRRIHEFGVIRVALMADSAFFSLRNRQDVRLDPETATMHRLSVRMILFILVLSALHISSIAPRKSPEIQLSQEVPLQPMSLSLPAHRRST
jgi:hypothetical protein